MSTEPQETKALPWYPRYLGDYSRKTQHLSMMEHGAYNLLLDHQYATGEPLPVVSSNARNLLERCYRIAGAITEDEREAVDKVIKDFFVQTPDGFVNKKASKVIAEQRLKHQKRVAAGRSGGKQKSSNALAMVKQCSGIAGSNGGGNQNQNQNIKEKIIKEKITLEDLDLIHVQGWLDEKRGQGKFMDIDEWAMLEMFKDYCLSKKPVYKDYVAAFRNSFRWNNAPKKGGSHEANSKSNRAKQAIARGIS